VLEAADLVHSNVATRVAVFADPPDVVDREFIRRGIAYEDAAARSERQLRSLGVTAIEQIPRAVAVTGAEGQVLPEWCDKNKFSSIIVVSTSDHSRRLRRVLHRSMKGHQTRVTVPPSDGTTPAARFFRRTFPDLFETVLSRIDALPQARRRKHQVALGH